MKGVLRPKMAALPPSAQIPKANLRRPPARFTHQVKVAQPFFYTPDVAREAAGNFSAGTRVALSTDEGPLARVVDPRGLSVYTRGDGLEPLPKARPRARRK